MVANVLARMLASRLEIDHGLFLLFSHVLGDFHMERNAQRTAARALRVRGALAADLQLSTVLRTGGNAYADLRAVGRGNHDFRAERSFGNRNGHRHEHVGAMA